VTEGCGTLHNLLTEPRLTVRGATRHGSGERFRLTLPGLLARLGAGEPTEPAFLQPHQEPALHAFLVQLAALALHRADSAGASEPRLDRSEKQWREDLRSLTDGEDEPWCLAVEEPTRPAFFQPPAPEGNLDRFKGPFGNPDALDLLVTTKNHDVKAERIVRPQPEHWVYALITLQTFQGYMGRGNYGIARMNGGFASRPSVGVVPALTLEARFRRDVEVLLESREKILDAGYGYPAEGGEALLWLLPWDGTESLTLRDCDPFFLEVCRRVRLLPTEEPADEDQSPNVPLAAWTAPSKTARLEAKELQGRTGDIWTPIRTKDAAALTVGGSGFSYALLQSLLFQDEYRHNPALDPRKEDGDEPWVVAQVLVRGQGTTDGWRERRLPVPKKVRRLLQTPAERDRLAEMARQRVANAGDARRRVLHPAICALLQPGASKLDLRDPRARVWSDRLDKRVDAIFFERLWQDAAPELAGETDRRWAEELVRLGREILEEAIRSVPLPSVRRYRAVAEARNRFEAGARKHLRAAFENLPAAGGDDARAATA
jgi:CRISPR system Cascade subunit CasA